jgi:hypothetical protein
VDIRTEKIKLKFMSWHGLGVCTAVLMAWPALAQPGKVYINSVIWNSLTDDDKAFVRSHQLVEVVDGTKLGVIVGVQGLNQSTPGNAAGSALGSAIAGAAYVDRAFTGPNYNYSALTHLGTLIIGQLAGSALDQKATASYFFRYSVRTLNGTIKYIEQQTGLPFHLAQGECLRTDTFETFPLAVCETEPVKFRSVYLQTPEALDATKPPDKAPDKASGLFYGYERKKYER